MFFFNIGYLYYVVTFNFVIVAGKAGQSKRVGERMATSAYRKEASSDSDDVGGLSAGEFEQNY